MTPHEQDLNEVIAVLNIRLERRHIEATEQSGQIGDLKRELAEVREKLSNAVVQADAYFTTYLEGVAERDRLGAAIERVRADCEEWTALQLGNDTDRKVWLRGVYAQAKRILNILDASGDAWRCLSCGYIVTANTEASHFVCTCAVPLLTLDAPSAPEAPGGEP